MKEITSSFTVLKQFQAFIKVDIPQDSALLHAEHTDLL
jgi:hypothetical protein